MTRRGRRSAAELMIARGPSAAIASRPDAPYDLGDLEANEWRAIVDSMPPEHFARVHFPMLTQLCRHIVAARRIDQLIAAVCDRDEFDRAEYAVLLDMQSRETAAIIRLSRSMRLTQLSIWHANNTKRLRPAPMIADAPWNSSDDNNED